MTFAILNFYSTEKRYTCVDAICRDGPESAFYQTWTALQQHIRTTHPPTCPHDECAGRTFSAQKGLRAHLRLHEQRAIEEHEHMSSEDEDEALPRKRRRGGEVGRDWKCEVDGCAKDFKSVRRIDFFFRDHF
jgi:general transcription factor IIIA